MQPAQPAPTTPPHGSAFPGQYPHDALHDRTRSPKTTLPDYHDPDSPTQKRGPGIARNPVSDTWRADAYEKREAGKGKIVDVAKRQDRWKCEYCGNLNERGVSGFVAAPGDEEGVGVAGSSRVYVGCPAPFPYLPKPRREHCLADLQFPKYNTHTDTNSRADASRPRARRTGQMHILR